MQILVCLHRREASQSGYFVNRKYDFAGGNSFRPINFLQLLLIFFPRVRIFSVNERKNMSAISRPLPAYVIVNQNCFR